MNKTILTTAISAILAVTAVASFAATLDNQKPDQAQITKQIQKVIPDAKVDSIRPAKIDGLYEVKAGTNVFYTTQSADYALYGHLLDLRKAEPVSLTEQSLKQTRLTMINELDPKSTIVFAPKDGNIKHTVTVFTDIDCAYCRKFHQEIPKLNAANIAVRYIAFPRAGNNSDSFKKAVAVWCADDQKAAMNKAKSGGNVPRKKGCKKGDVIRSHLQLVHDLDLQATPILFLEDGTEIPGYIPAERLIKKVSSMG